MKRLLLLLSICAIVLVSHAEVYYFKEVGKEINSSTRVLVVYKSGSHMTYFDESLDYISKELYKNPSYYIQFASKVMHEPNSWEGNRGHGGRDLSYNSSLSSIIGKDVYSGGELEIVTTNTVNGPIYNRSLGIRDYYICLNSSKTEARTWYQYTGRPSTSMWDDLEHAKIGEPVFQQYWERLDEKYLKYDPYDFLRD